MYTELPKSEFGLDAVHQRIGRRRHGFAARECSAPWLQAEAEKIRPVSGRGLLVGDGLNARTQHVLDALKSPGRDHGLRRAYDVVRQSAGLNDFGISALPLNNYPRISADCRGKSKPASPV